jgi:hypothetical protein
MEGKDVAKQTQQDPKPDQQQNQPPAEPGQQNPPPGDGNQDGESQSQGSQSGAVRVICTRQNAGALINGKLFADVPVAPDGTATLHISEAMTAAEADAFTRISGYSIFEGSVENAVIEQALEQARRAPASEIGNQSNAVTHDLRRQLEEHQASNLRLSERLRESTDREKRLVEENAALKKENEELRTAAGVGKSAS